MMSAAHAAGRINHYKKRPTTTPTKVCKRRNSQQSVASSTDSVTTPTSSKRDSLTVPDTNGLRRRSGSVPAIKLITLASEWNLKESHIRAIKMTWARLCEPPRSHCKGIVALVERVWCKLDTKDVSVREIFYKAAFVGSMQERCERRRQSSHASMATLRDHTHFFVSLVSQLVQHLENEPDEMFAHLDKIGRNHAYLKQYGFKSTHWEKVGEYFIDTVVIQDCVRAYPDACRAWTFLVAAMVDRLRAAPRRGSISTIGLNTTRGSKEELNVAPVRIFGSGNIVCPQAPRSARGSMCDIYAGSRRSSHCDLTKLDNGRSSSDGELKLDSLKISSEDIPKIEIEKEKEMEKEKDKERKTKTFISRLADVKECLIERKNGMSMDAASCPLAALRERFKETKSGSAKA